MNEKLLKEIMESLEKEDMKNIDYKANVYSLAHQYGVDKKYIDTLIDRKSDFNYSLKEICDFIESELELLRRECIYLIYEGYENDEYFNVSKEYYNRMQSYKMYVQDSLVKKHNL